MSSQTHPPSCRGPLHAPHRHHGHVHSDPFRRCHLGDGSVLERPPASRTGAPAAGALPAEATCTQCHVNFDEEKNPVNNLNLPGGAVELLDMPSTYMPGQTYTLRVRLSSDSTADEPDRKWGFQVTAFRTSDGLGTGTFTVSTTELKVVAGNPSGAFASRRYVEHTSTGTRTGIAGPVEWQFDWHLPEFRRATCFSASGNAADGTLDPGKNFIYTSSAPRHGHPGRVQHLG
ncbi:MAG TPA: choice-of-anchor V domain-containing protein [Candidatus Limnocylindria bacterium]|nr:choice-of-anchor V domain-containing protein [Candidatus Limnocylindria bacterium]